LVGDATLTITPGDGSWQGLRERIIIVRNEPGGKKLNFGSNVFWGTQTPPDYTGMSAQDFDIVRLLSFNDGVSWFAESAYASGGGTDNSFSTQIAIQNASEEVKTLNISTDKNIFKIIPGDYLVKLYNVNDKIYMLEMINKGDTKLTYYAGAKVV
jgi:hypothetical protein